MSEVRCFRFVAESVESGSFSPWMISKDYFQIKRAYPTISAQWLLFAIYAGARIFIPRWKTPYTPIPGGRVPRVSAWHIRSVY
jgi:hypothetical protein